MAQFPRSAVLGTCLGLAISLGGSVKASAQLINFDDLVGRSSFFDAGIASTYKGFHWGTSLFGTQATSTGWAYGSSNSITGADPIPVSAPTQAWTFNGPRSLFIDFLAPTNVTSAWFASLYPVNDPNGSRSITMIGYNAAGTVIGTSSTLNLTFAMQQLNANFVGVRAVEFRSDRESSWFTVDNLQLNGAVTVAPEPATWALLGAGLLVTGLATRRRQVRHL